MKKNNMGIILVIIVVIGVFMMSGGKKERPAPPVDMVFDVTTDELPYGNQPPIQGSNKYAMIFGFRGVPEKTKLQQVTFYYVSQSNFAAAYIYDLGPNGEWLSDPLYFFQYASNHYDRFIDSKLLPYGTSGWFIWNLDYSKFTVGHRYGIYFSSPSEGNLYLHDGTNPTGLHNYIIHHTSSSPDDPGGYIPNQVFAFNTYVEPECITDTDCSGDYTCKDAGTPMGECAVCNTPADNNPCDGTITWSELDSYITSWALGNPSITWSLLDDVITQWALQ